MCGELFGEHDVCQQDEYKFQLYYHESRVGNGVGWQAKCKSDFMYYRAICSSGSQASRTPLQVFLFQQFHTPTQSQR